MPAARFRRFAFHGCRISVIPGRECGFRRRRCLYEAQEIFRDFSTFYKPGTLPFVKFQGRTLAKHGLVGLKLRVFPSVTSSQAVSGIRSGGSGSKSATAPSSYAVTVRRLPFFCRHEPVYCRATFQSFNISMEVGVGGGFAVVPDSVKEHLRLTTPTKTLPMMFIHFLRQRLFRRRLRFGRIFGTRVEQSDAGFEVFESNAVNRCGGFPG